MAKLFKKLQKALSSYEDRPVEMITKAKLGDFTYIIRGTDRGSDAWHCILVPIDKVAQIKAHQAGSNINVLDFGTIIEYRDHQRTIRNASQWGKDPPEMINAWIDEQYGPASIDASINMTYDHDDIRLCTMQRAIPQQKLGVYRCYYHRQERFHYMELIDDLPLSLARRSGVKNYDRVIFFNGINIENDTYDQFATKFQSSQHLPIQMLVCSPATYAYYKANNQSFRIDLPTVQRLTPVYATTTTDSNTNEREVSANPDSFCSIRWDDSGIVSTVSQLTVYKSPEFTKVNDICFVDREGDYERGRILHIGSYHECEKLKTVSIVQRNAMNIDSVSTWIKNAPEKTVKNVPSILEDLPNELFLGIFTYLNIDHLYNAFWGLNERLSSLFRSYENSCLIFGHETDQLSIEPYARFITRLVIDAPNKCDLTQFPNLQALVLCDRSSKHLQQIQPQIVPKLSHLSFLLGSKFTPSSALVDDVFSNEYPCLRSVSLSRVNDLSAIRWSTSPALRFVSIRSNQPLIISCILASCPNLDHLQLHVCDPIGPDAMSSPPANHPLRWFTLWSDSIELTSTKINVLLSNTPNVQRLYLQTVYNTPFIFFAKELVSQLNYLSRFDCHIKEMLSKSTRIDELTDIQHLHPCFSRIECDNDKDDFRIFYTK